MDVGRNRHLKAWFRKAFFFSPFVKMVKHSTTEDGKQMESKKLHVMGNKQGAVSLPGHTEVACKQWHIL